MFIDDLDRCLPANALEVLESMKLFFDMEGFVFVTGLDQAVVEAAVASKYNPTDNAGPAAAITGTNYIKKVFQVPFALPRISTGQLNEYLDDIIARAELVPAQQQDFDVNVRPHLEVLDRGRVSQSSGGKTARQCIHNATGKCYPGDSMRSTLT